MIRPGEELVFRSLRVDEVEARINKYKDDADDAALTLLLYKDARCDMRVLDETVGPQNWQREHYECKGNLFCRVGIKLPDWPEWVWKADCGSESNTETQKGEASDSFKRACFCWGLGRELYTAPFIYVPKIGSDGKANFESKRDRFKVTYMRVEDGRIVALNIENSKKRRSVYSFGNILPEATCEVCGKSLTKDFAAKSVSANSGHIFCSGTCKKAFGDVQ